MRRPRIGIPTSLDDRGRWRAGRAYHYIDRRYADAIDAAGGLPVQLPIQSDPAALIAGLDALLLPGGDDLPSEAPLPAAVVLDLVPAEQLAFDEALYDAAVERALPVLGLCYGMQLMARRRGGRLVADLASQRPDSAPHRLADADRHAVSLAPDSRLAAILGTTALAVNSLHRQAIETPGPAHRAVAHAPDGVLEAIEARARDTEVDGPIAGDGAAGRFEIGVQWHPEKLDDAASGRLFAAFVEAARERAAGR